MRAPVHVPTLDELSVVARRHGIEHVGVAPAEVLERARTALVERKRAGLHSDMQFTYRNPERSTDPQRAVPGARSVVVAARSYATEHEPERPEGVQARVARYAWVDHYEPLRDGLREMASQLKAAGERAVVFADDNSIVDREIAHLGGLGWFGKNANLLLPGAGSFFVLGCVITTAEYAVSTPVPDGCGSCRRCLDACPTDAIVAPGVVDANRCLAWLVQRGGTFPSEHRRALGDRMYGCDDCQEVCPPTVRFGRRHTVEADHDIEASHHIEAWVDVLDLLDATDHELLERHGRWYVADRDPRWWRRNALVVLGNTGDSTDRRTRETLERYRGGHDPILAEHAQWAAAELGLIGSTP